MSAYIGASPASRRFQSLKELTGSPTCRQKACWESPLWACSSTQACHCEAGWREWRRFDMGTDAPSVNDGISVGGQAISRNDAPGWPLTATHQDPQLIAAVILELGPYPGQLGADGLCQPLQRLAAAVQGLVTWLQRQVGEVDIDGQPWEGLDEEVDGRTTLKGKAGFVIQKGQQRDQQAHLFVIAGLNAHP